MHESDRAQQIAQAMAAINGGNSPSAAVAAQAKGKTTSKLPIILVVVLAFVAVTVMMVKFIGSRADELSAYKEEAPVVEEQTVTNGEEQGTTDTARVVNPDESLETQTETYLLVDTPSKNLSCQIFEDRVGCSIAERHYDDLGLPNCKGRLFSIVVTDYGVDRVCGQEFLGKSGDFVRELQYGESIKSTNGRYQCSIAESGMTCNNTLTGHGFKIARETQKIF